MFVRWGDFLDFLNRENKEVVDGVEASVEGPERGRETTDGGGETFRENVYGLFERSMSLETVLVGRGVGLSTLR